MNLASRVGRGQGRNLGALARGVAPGGLPSARRLTSFPPPAGGHLQANALLLRALSPLLPRRLRRPLAAAVAARSPVVAAGREPVVLCQLERMAGASGRRLDDP